MATGEVLSIAQLVQARPTAYKRPAHVVYLSGFFLFLLLCGLSPVQVTSEELRLVEAASFSQVHSWKAPQGVSINAASATATQVRRLP